MTNLNKEHAFYGRVDPELLADFGENPGAPRTGGPDLNHALSTVLRSLGSNQFCRGATENLYLPLVETSEEYMTQAFLNAQGAHEIGHPQERDPAESLERHKSSVNSTPKVQEDGKECGICGESKPEEGFPKDPITEACAHPCTICSRCIARCIRADLDTKSWKTIACPECPQVLSPHDVWRLADPATRERYDHISVCSTLAEDPDFIWCSSNCGLGQIHDGGREQPIVTCSNCSARTCFQHNVTWHENLSCEEYDEFMKDPLNFRSYFDRENKAPSEAERELLVKLAREEQRQSRQGEAEEAERLATRRREEDRLSSQMVERTSKPCPGCGWAIEKNGGCAHMTCKIPISLYPAPRLRTPVNLTALRVLPMPHRPQYSKSPPLECWDKLLKRYIARYPLSSPVLLGMQEALGQ